MSEASELFKRPGSESWLILSGDTPSLGGATPRLGEHLLEHSDLSWPPAFLLLEQRSPDPINQFMTDMETLIGVEARVLMLEDEVPMEVAQVSQAARLLIMADGDAQGWRAAMDPNVLGLDGESLLSQGRVVLAIGAAAAALGSWMYVDSSNTIEPGLGWLQGAVIMPRVMDPAEVELVRHHLRATPKAYAVGLPSSVLLALGPEGQIEVWSERSPVIALSSGWSRP